MIVRRLTAAMLLCSTIGCYTISPVAAPNTFIPQQNPERVWVTNDLGETFLLERPMVRGDSIVGTLAATSEQFSVPLAAPGSTVFARQKSRSKTAQLIGSVGLLVGLTAFGLIVGSDGEKGCAQSGMRGCPPQ